MEDKKNFGAYILQRRKALGLTQRQFADKLFVTESAVSKWERGLSYPDITMIHDICAVLEISEHELLTASEDVERRTAEALAQRYLRLMRNLKLVQWILYGGTALVCFICNLAVGHTLDWFWIVLTAEVMCACLTLLPVLLKQRKLPAVLGGFTLGLELLLFTCGIYTGDLSWFPVAAIGSLLGLCVVFLPLILRQLPLPETWRGQRLSLYLGCCLLLTVLLFVACGLYSGSVGWVPVASAGVLLGLCVVFLPAMLRQLPLPEDWKTRKLTLYLAICTVFLFLLFLVCGQYSSDVRWVPVACMGVLLGLCVVFLPLVLRQLPLPQGVNRHKALLYMGICTLLLYGLLWICSWYQGGHIFLAESAIAAYCLLIPWGLLGALRYLPVNWFFRAAAAVAWTGIFTWCSDGAINNLLVLLGYSGEYRPLIQPFNLLRWKEYYAGNINLIIAFTMFLAAVILFGLGFWWQSRKKPR